MATRIIPDQAWLRERLAYNPDTGELRWRFRPREDFPSVHEWHRWNTRHSGDIAGHENPKLGHRVIHINHVMFFAHRVIWKMQTDHEPEEIDHRDVNGFNNRWDNLRLAVRTQNMANRKSWNSLGIKGVQRHGAGFRARIRFQSELYCLGTFPTAEEAHAAYRAVAKIYFGAFANFD